MLYRFRRTEPVTHGLRRIAAEQIATAIGEATDPAMDIHDAVHEVRKRCKMIRALLRLVRPAIGDTYQFENAWFRDAARTLSSLRDAQSIVATFDTLLESADDGDDRLDLDRVRQRLLQRRDHLVSQQLDARERLTAFADQLRIAATRVEHWKIEGREFETLAGGFALTYRRGRRAFAEAYEAKTPEAFHDWRKRVKYHWYHLRLLDRVWKQVVRERRDAMDQLADLLGDDHDLAVLDQTLRVELAETIVADQIQQVRRLCDQRRAALEKQAKPLGKRLYADRPKSLVRRYRTYWNTWRDLD